jgi:hypothetical protein
MQTSAFVDDNSRWGGGSAGAVSWGAILAGAVGAAALSLILLMLGVGLGLSSVSPWARNGMGDTGFGMASILWIILTQLLACAMGGFLAGRLRTKWVGVESDEVYFRDTAHGFLAWAMASLLTAAALTTMIASIVGSSVQVAASLTAGNSANATAAAPAGRTTGQIAYFVDSLFRPTTAAAADAPPAPDSAMGNAEISRIFLTTFADGKLPQDDLQYAGQVVARRTGLTQPEAQQRVSDTYLRLQTQLSQAQASAKDAAETARKASARVSLWLFISLLVGAFVASFAAIYGGRLRDA